MSEDNHNEVMMTLGGTGKEGFQFSVNTAAYQTFRRSSQYRWQEQNRLSVQPVQQFIGPGSESIALDGVIYPHYMGGLGQIQTIRDLANKGEGLTLIAIQYLEGENIGLWCIKSITENRTEFSSGGIPLRIKFSISLVAYGEKTQ